jgi:twinkle protein
LPARGLSEETCRKWNYTVGEAPHPKTKKVEKVQVANYCDDSGRVIGQKVRWKDKTFQTTGEFKKAGLYGKHLWRDGGKKIVVTEGEIDALTVSQLQSNKWPVVSLANGAQSAKKALAADLEWLNKFDEVVLMFDDDEPGRAAVEDCTPLFPPGKCKIARIPGYKDANEAHVDGKGNLVIDATWAAKEHRPDGIVDIMSTLERAVSAIVRGLSWPWDTLSKLTYGRRRGEVYGFAGGTGMGKTTLFKQVQAHIVTVDKLPIGIIALEEPTHHSVKTLAGVIDGVRYHVPDVEFDPQQLSDTIKSLDGLVYLYDHFGAATFETIIEKVRYMRHAFGVRDFFLDHLTALAATMGDDERKAIDKMMAELSALMIELDATLYYISHLATPEGKSHEEGGRVLEKHFRGSRSIAYWSHFLFGLEGDKQKPGSPRKLRCLKDRYTGDANGLVIGLQYQKDTGRLVECSLEEDGGHGFRDESGGNDGAPF